MKLTEIVTNAKKLSRHGDLLSYPAAAIQALKDAGYKNPHQTLRVTMYLHVDIHTIQYDDRTSLLSLVTKALGQEGRAIASINQAKARQLLFTI